MWALTSSSPLILRCIFRRPPSPHISSIAPSFLKRSSITRISSIPLSLSTGEETGILSQIEIEDKLPIETASEHFVDARISTAHKELLSKLKSMSVKEKKDLGSYAHSLGKKLKSQQVGKSGVTDSVATALVETLEANELLKSFTYHNSDITFLFINVSTIISMRPSLTKLKAEEKKKQAMKVFLKRRATFKSSYQGRMQSRGQSATPSNRSRDFRRA
ncbi:hypothetical protein R6Q57_006910 [Mikania cordata]